MIFQDPQTALNPVLSIGHQIGEVLSRVGVERANRRDRAIELLDRVGIPGPSQRLTAYPHQLSGGMKQRVSIAMALAGEPDVLIADEPTTALDITIQSQILALLREIQASTDMAMLLITHDLGVVAKTADEVGVMYAGHLVERAPAATFFAKPHHPYTQGLFAAISGLGSRKRALSVIPGAVPNPGALPVGCRFQSRCSNVWDECVTRLPALREHCENHWVRCHLYDQQPPIVPKPLVNEAVDETDTPSLVNGGVTPLLTLDDVRVEFPMGTGFFRRGADTVRAVNGVSLSISPSRTLAVVGESGCGKSTLAKAIVGLLNVRDGAVSLEGDSLNGLGLAELRQRRADFQIIFQDAYASMNPRMRVLDIVAEGLTIHRWPASKSQRQERALKLLQQVGIDQSLSARFAHELSGGQRQRVCIARALALEPKLIVCDEPTSALDVSMQAQILNLLKRLQSELGIAYLLITHDISVVSFLADEVAVMYLGKIVERGATQEVLRVPKHPYTQALMSALPSLDLEKREHVVRLTGELPSPTLLPSGCAFHPRCQSKLEHCTHQTPVLMAMDESRSVACHLYSD